MSVEPYKRSKKAVLFLGREFQHPNNACGICLYNLALELINRGCEIYVISLVPKKSVFKYDSNIHVTELYEDRFTTLCNVANGSSNWLVKLFYKIIQFLRLFLVSIITPNTAPLKSREIYRVAKHIIFEYGVDTVIGSYTPYETISASVLLKKWKPGLKVVNYHLDPLLAPGNSSRFISQYKYRRAYNAVIKEISIVNKILVPETFYEIYPVNDKICSVGFPLYRMSCDVNSVPYKFNSDIINMVYVGTLDSKNRNISYTLELIERLNTVGLNVRLHIWGTLLDSETIELVRIRENVEYHGLINSNLVPTLLSSADFLLNVCNFTHSSSLPSKIFQLFASRKPILVIKRSNNDASLPYFIKYGNVHFAEEGDFSIDHIRRLQAFFTRGQNNFIIEEAKENVFFKYTPYYICDQIDI